LWLAISNFWLIYFWNVLWRNGLKPELEGSSRSLYYSESWHEPAGWGLNFWKQLIRKNFTCVILPTKLIPTLSDRPVHKIFTLVLLPCTLTYHNCSILRHVWKQGVQVIGFVWSSTTN
jgi:hypothetical protein